MNVAPSVAAILRQRNSGWYGWDTDTQASNLKALLTIAFEQSQKTGSESAADIFWTAFEPYDGRDDSLEKFLARADNAWVKKYIAAYEKRYGVGFYDVTPVNWLGLTAVKVGLAVAAFAVVLLIGLKTTKKLKKQ